MTQGIVAKLISKMGTRAEGGPTDAKVPYIVGEKGPELFVPKTDGTIIPNHVIGRQSGGPVTAGGSSISKAESYLMGMNPNKVSAGDFAQAMLVGLGAPTDAQNVANLKLWMSAEGGNWLNTAHFNPLNTSYGLNGSTNFNTGMAGGGVQAYKSWKDGLDATLGTLTGQNAGARGYANLVKMLQGGNCLLYTSPSPRD